MILRKPYAFFIRMFKPMHLIMSALIVYLIYLQNKILSYLNSYIYSSNTMVGENIKEKIFSNLLYILPIIIIVLCLIILGVMFRKKKPTLLYFVCSIAYLIVIIINFYTSNFLVQANEAIVSIKIVKFIHDLVFINMIIEVVSFIFFIIRGMGINFKKFDFDSEIAKFDISESDKEEFELNINVDLNESKTRRRRYFRNIKYRYLENKLLINSIVATFIIVVGVVIFLLIRSSKKYNEEGVIYSASSFDFVVSNTYLLNTDYQNNKITEDYLIVVSTDIKSHYSSNSIYLKDFSLKIDEFEFKPTTKYSNYLVDIGNAYDESILSTSYTNYLFIFEIPTKFITSEMIFNYNDKGINIDIVLNPKELVSTSLAQTKNLKDEISFNDVLGDIKFSIDEFEISDKFKLQYNYCISNDDCIVSYEYVKASIDKNYDKDLMKISVDYSDNSNLKVNSFYKFFNRFGSISYEIDGKWYTQTGGFEEVKSSKVNNKKIVYIGINSNIKNASQIKLVFDVRGSKYEYILK